MQRDNHADRSSVSMLLQADVIDARHIANLLAFGCAAAGVADIRLNGPTTDNNVIACILTISDYYFTI